MFGPITAGGTTTVLFFALRETPTWMCARGTHMDPGGARPFWRDTSELKGKVVMLVPHQNHSHLCQRCGRSLTHITAFCPSCGATLVFPWPGQRAGTYPHPPFSPTVPVPQPSSAPLIVELLLNCLGIYGVGWLMIGNRGVGLPLLICSVILWPMVLLFTLFTLGLVLLCLGPLGIAAIVGNAFLLQRAITSKQRAGAVWVQPKTPPASSGRATEVWIFIDDHTP
jgi:hypothetical protein